MSDWIKVEDRLPEKSGNVLCYAISSRLNLPYSWVYHFSTIDSEFIGNDVNVITHRVTHWMPLPEPPKQ